MNWTADSVEAPHKVRYKPPPAAASSGNVGEKKARPLLKAGVSADGRFLASPINTRTARRRGSTSRTVSFAAASHQAGNAVSKGILVSAKLVLADN